MDPTTQLESALGETQYSMCSAGAAGGGSISVAGIPASAILAKPGSSSGSKENLLAIANTFVPG
ncbi:MAG: hypothetical protein ABL921_33345, partial [Pirellula sp.]